MTVRSILSRKGRSIVTIDPTASLAEAAKLLSEHGIGAVIVTDMGGRVAGMLSERDIVRGLAAHGPDVLGQRVDQVMTRRIVTCVENDTLGELMERMTNGRFRHLPVVESGRLTGIVSIGDVVKSRLEEIEAESNALREYIATA